MAADADSWERLWSAYLRFYKTDLSPDVFASTFRRLLDPAEPMHGALAEIDGAAVGLVHYIEHRSCWTVGNYLYLQDLFADEAVRGRGVGRGLIAHVYAEAARLGCARVWWLTHESNEQAMVLYDKVADKSGFVQYRKLL